MAPPLPSGDAQHVGGRHMILRSEYIRLLEQALAGLGYPALASQLEAESVRATVPGSLRRGPPCGVPATA